MDTQKKMNVGLAVTGSFCNFSKVVPIVEDLLEAGFHVVPIFSENSASFDTRFANAKEFCGKICTMTGEKGIFTIPEAEPIGPKSPFDLLIIAPCTGNTAAKLACGITDSTVLMAAKAHLRNQKPLLLAISTNDGLGMNFKNIGLLYAAKYIYFVPFGQDDPVKKPNSLVFHSGLVAEAARLAMQGEQMQPLLREYPAA